MTRRFHPAALALLLLAGCGTSPPPAAYAQAPLYPYWPIARMPSGPQSGERQPAPTATAVLVAPGYLLTAIAGMGDVADDFSLDPAVYVFDGTAWHAGRYVDRDKALRVALIRADVPGTPMKLSDAGSRPSRLVGTAPFVRTAGMFVVRAWRGEPCAELPSWLDDDIGPARRPSLCVAGRQKELPGGIMVDAAGRLAGIQVNPLGAGEAAGPDAADIRAYLDLYFSTWGAAVTPKPAY
ncbi:MAG: hypothetical protein RL272_1062 [Candidatus Parcubacteria bacterium]|jgi:hypothetical protein